MTPPDKDTLLPCPFPALRKATKNAEKKLTSLRSLTIDKPLEFPLSLRKDFEQHLFETDGLPLDKSDMLAIDCFIDFLNGQADKTTPKVRLEDVFHIAFRASASAIEDGLSGEQQVEEIAESILTHLKEKGVIFDVTDSENTIK